MKAMIEIRWRMGEFEQVFTDAILDADHLSIVGMIDAANVSHDYRSLIDHIDENVIACDLTLQHYPTVDRVQAQDALKRIVQSLYDNCPGLKQAVMAYGMIDPDFLP